MLAEKHTIKRGSRETVSTMEEPKYLNQLLQAQTPNKLVYLFSRDYQFASYISQQITHFGYQIQHVREIKSLANIAPDNPLVAILIDVPAEEDAGSSIFTEIRGLQLGAHALIFISEQDDQAARLKAIQAGGAAFFTKPIHIVSLVDKLDGFNRSINNPQLFRVLIVEDQYTVASYYQMVLKSTGMDAQVVVDSNNVLEQVREFHPDLILMDTFMSDGNTADLARVIRQIDEFVSIPIIFLSNEDDFSKRIEALDLGGDDFLIKPIKASRLKAVVRSRLERSRVLRSYMVRDSLTNLYNHTSFRSILAREVSRAARQGTTLSLVMLDIDHFKSVNDTYGHAAGDIVLKGLARLLKQRLRSSDIVGRYGGDELVALLTDCDETQATRILDEIRIHFSEIEFNPERDASVFLTFSCGVSSFPQFLTAEALSDAADQALYKAKKSGRNKVVTAQ